ncbi:AEC family transporter [Methylomonas sp. SURF-2]|uniref:AEC family transporter n=1 Tax=Methylomonas subterranea TaxID=2952225 RepID=A0ABT1TIQ8_9GAMM|nr:AEC family transporter [Methylomonas sp. SURF-2]MCQ8105091.1 AEC family transporter [Methylomonas sp. SURF-2]
MNDTLIQMTLMMLCGAGWRLFSLRGLSADQTRLALTSVVYYVFLPAMILDVLWRADIGWQSIQFSALGCATIVAGLVLSWSIARLLKFKRPQTGAVILATAFPNVTYLGLPVLEQAYGSWSRSVVIQIDLFATAPLVFTLGIAVARHYGDAREDKTGSLLGFFNTPPFWAALLAVVLNLNQLVAPDWLMGLLQKMSAAVAPLMIFSLGLALSWRAIHWRNLPYILPVVGLRLALLPWMAWHIADAVQLQAPFKSAAVLDLAMPSMVLGVVFCDRYGLDSALYATAVTITTLLSLLSLPFWFGVL